MIETTKTPAQLTTNDQIWDGGAWVPVLGPAEISGDTATIPVLLYGAFPVEIERPAAEALRVQA